MKNRNIADFFKLAFNFKTTRCGNILKVNSAKAAGNEVNCADNFVYVLGTKADRISVNVGKLLKKYALPAIIAMTASSLYKMIDSIYIGQGVGPLAISGLAVTFPLMNLSTAFGTLVGAGAATILSVFLGRK